MSTGDSPSHPLDLAVRLEPQGGGLSLGRTTAEYANMVGPFGGVIAAVMLNAVQGHPHRLGEPVAFTVNYAGPIADGEFLIEARPARTNRSTQHWGVEIRQSGQVAATATGVWAQRRETWSAIELGFPDVPPVGSIARHSFVGRAAWTQRYDMRFVRGALDLAEPPLEEAADSLSTLWIRDDPPRRLDFVSLVALCDAFFPRIFVRRPRWAPIGTVSYTTYFHADGDQLTAHGDGHVLGAARAQQFRNGFFDQSAEVWAGPGQLLATSHQIVYYRE